MRAGAAHALARARPRAEAVPWLWHGLVAAAATAVLVPSAVWRYVDGDEGYYLLSSELVMDGALPYRDFMFTQMPLLPYLYGAWTAVLGDGWLAARLLSVAFAVGVAVLLFHFASRRFGRGLALVGAALYVFSGLVFAWFPTVKTYAPATFFLFAALALADRRPATARWAWFAAGVLAALAADVRLIFAAAAPAFAWAAVHAAGGGQRLRALTPFAAGFGVGLSPALLFLALDPGRFLFDNVGYHAFRSTEGLVGDFRQKARVAANLLGVGTPDGAIPQFLLLALAAAAAALVVRRLGRPLPLALVVAGLLGAASFLPTPTYPQYFVTLVPFLVAGILELPATIRTRAAASRDPSVQRAFGIGLAACVAVYLLLSTVDLYRYTRLHSDDRIGDVERVAAIVDRHTRPGEAVLSAWPGYVYGSGAVQLSGLENDFAPVIASSLSEERARHYRLLTARGVEEAILARRARVVVPKLWHYQTPVPDWDGALRRAGYRLVFAQPPAETVFAGEVEVYVAPDG
jgi:4-amino-4-deoxy-L-arabinose transferase-like glycosyltransferase